MSARVRAAAALLAVIALLHGGALAGATPLDTLAFGVAADEQAHGLVAPLGEIVAGGLGEPARQLLPRPMSDWQGGSVSFAMACDPARQTYLTVKFWGSDAGEDLGRLTLFCAGKQVGYRHLGDIDQLDIAGAEPACPGRFFYTTTPLPLALTAGKRQIPLEIRVSGRIWGYGVNWEQYQKPLDHPSRGIYRAYTHLDGCFAPPDAERQGTQPASPPLRQAPGEELLDRVRQRVAGECTKELAAAAPPGQLQMQFLAEAYHVAWTPAHHAAAAVRQVCAGADALYRRFHADAKVAQADPQVYNADWLGLGPAGNAIRLLQAPLQARLDEEIDDGGGGRIARRAAWSQMLQASVEWHRRHRRQYTNQTMINDLYLYLANRGVAAIDPAHAMPEDRARRYLYESIGLQPWLGSDNDQGSDLPLGSRYMQTTAKGLTKELGYVGYYGEVLDWVGLIYQATREPGDERDGDARIKAQFQRLTEARSYFRYPALDADGNRAMRIETVVGWRDTHVPGDVTYGERADREGSALFAAVSLRDAGSVGSAQQMIADHQFFMGLEAQLKEGGVRITRTMMHVPDEYAAIMALPPSGKRLPLAPGQGDALFSDEDDGVVVVRHGDEILYASLYWRARYAVNSLARVHAIGPRYERIAVVAEQAEFTPSGLQYTRPDWVNFGFANGGLRYPGDLHSAHAGEKLPIARLPEGTVFKPGQEHPAAGRADFYALRYGDWLIGMNCTADRTFRLAWPKDVARAVSLPGGAAAAPDADGASAVPPVSTVVLWLGR
jgi:hypothetical protein